MDVNLRRNCSGCLQLAYVCRNYKAICEFDRLSHCHCAVFVESQSSRSCSNNVGRGPFGQHQELLPLAAEPDFPNMRRVLVSNS